MPVILGYSMGGHFSLLITCKRVARGIISEGECTSQLDSKLILTSSALTLSHSHVSIDTWKKLLYYRGVVEAKKQPAHVHWVHWLDGRPCVYSRPVQHIQYYIFRPRISLS